MKVRSKWRAFGFDHVLWDVVRYYRSLRAKGEVAETWLSEVRKTNAIIVEPGKAFPVEPALIKNVVEYIEECARDSQSALGMLRNEQEAIAFCQRLGVVVGKTVTQNKDHHQSSKAMVAAVSAIASKVCGDRGIGVNPNPQRRAVWCSNQGLHVSARNVDGAVPTLANPSIVWEIKEYWGGNPKQKGGSKMSDAVYECHLVAREIRDFEKRANVSIAHAVFVDGQSQWNARKSDLTRLVDLFHQGLVDMLIIGREVETQWESFLRKSLRKSTPTSPGTTPPKTV